MRLFAVVVSVGKMMICAKPYTGDNGVFGCGQCTICRINKRRVWSHRMMLESVQHEQSSFLTLTYDDEHLPEGHTLRPDDTKAWLKKFRERLRYAYDNRNPDLFYALPRTIRYFLVGEYGEKTQRPHYHAALFGFPPCFYFSSPSAKKQCSCPSCSVVRDTWGKGHIMLGTLTHDSAQYIAGYVTKKMTSPEDPRLKGRFPEYARMSNRPGIGAYDLEPLSTALSTVHGTTFISETHDVPSVLRFAGSKMPLGRYIKRKLREELGFVETSTPAEILQALRQEMSLVREDYLSDSQAQKEGLNFSQYLARISLPTILSREGKQKLFNARRHL